MDNRIKSADLPLTLEIWRDSKEDQNHDYRIKKLTKSLQCRIFNSST